MTTAEIVEELGRQGIGQQSIENALGVLAQKKSACRAAQPNTIPPQPKCRPRQISRMAIDARGERTAQGFNLEWLAGSCRYSLAADCT